MAGTPGWELPNWLEGWKRVILIDAVQMGMPPGAFRRFSPEEVRLITAEERLSSHESDLAAGLALAQALDRLPEELVIFGVEPEHCEPGSALSPIVEQALDRLIADILDEINHPAGSIRYPTENAESIEVVNEPAPGEMIEAGQA
jgi:hydrogenase maturation protease